MDFIRKIFRILIAFTLLTVDYSFSVYAQQLQPVPNQRMAGYHYSVVFTGEAIPGSALMTYPVKNFDALNYNFLVKFMPCLLVEGKIVYPSAFRNVRVEDFPGEVEASFMYENTTIRSRITPQLVGRGAITWTGASFVRMTKGSGLNWNSH